MNNPKEVGYIIRKRKGAPVMAHILLDTGKTACKTENGLKGRASHKRYEPMNKLPDSCPVCKNCLAILGHHEKTPSPLINGKWILPQ